MGVRGWRRHGAWLRLVAALAFLVLLGMCNLTSVARATAGAAANEQSDAAAIRWEPQLAPRGPVVVVVSLPAQRVQVYRNGIRIGTAPVSTGRPGYETPPGIYTILGKEREHHSNLYDDAPMPYMQRLTWDGVALHAGALPGRPSSHGCIRLPETFAAALFEATSLATTVVVTDAPEAPSLLVPVPLASGDAGIAAALPLWRPEAAPEGPVSVLLSTASGVVVVFRDGVEIGRLPVQLDATALPAGTTAYVLLEGTLPFPSPLAPERPARPWMAVPLGDARDATAAPQPPFRGRLGMPAEYALALYDLLAPGTVLVVSDEPLPATAP